MTIGAGEGNRTLVVSLGSSCSTIELHPRPTRSPIMPRGRAKSGPHRVVMVPALRSAANRLLMPGLEGITWPTPRFLRRPRNSAIRDVTAKGERRARVGLSALRTLWLNTGSLCNITCRNCYIDSSPDNDRLAYLTRAEAAAFLDEIARDWLAGARDRLHRRRAVHESRHHRPCSAMRSPAASPCWC